MLCTEHNEKALIVGNNDIYIAAQSVIVTKIWNKIIMKVLWHNSSEPVVMTVIGPS